jgi:hypothetical protein
MTDQTQEQRDYSVQDLDNAVAAGQITQTQRDHIFAQQVERTAMKAATEAATQIVQQETFENSLDSELQQYASVAPDVMRDGSPLRARIAEEFQYLVNRGAAKDLSTELAAVRAVMGPLERAKSFAAGRSRRADMSHDSFSSRPMSVRERRIDDHWSRLSPVQQQYYDKHIQSGIYADRAAVISEINWTRRPQAGRR